MRVPKVIGLEMTIGHHISRTLVNSGTASLIPFARIFEFVKSLRRNSVGLGHSSSEVESLIEEENWVGIYETTF